MAKSAVEVEQDRIARLSAARALHPVTIAHLSSSIQERLKHPKYELPAQSSDRSAIGNANRGYRTRVRAVAASLGIAA